ncbi:cupin domain-containing protein [Methylobacterium oryzisoli]|uniref:cupin domain-containing protein n=1 Tax=Methylobacterium oryzisoli TaxID=3385502 RepID=UPI0038925D3C
MPDTLPPLTPDPGNDGIDPNRPPAAPYYLMSTGPDGLSRLVRQDLTGFELQSVGGGAAPQWMRDFPGEVEAVKFNILPKGWVGEWHESPRPQWVVPLSGRWFLETQSGQRVEMGPGDIHFGCDQGTRDGKGHRSGQIGETPCVQIMIQFRTSPLSDKGTG